MNTNKAHGLLGHRNLDATRVTAKSLGWEIVHGRVLPCEFCARGKAKQKNVSKESDVAKSTKPCKRVYLDLSKVTVPTGEGDFYMINKKWWKIIVCEATGKKWTDFSTTKDGSVERSCELFNKLKSRGMPVKFVRRDPAGEDQLLEKRAGSVDWQNLQPLTFEFTSRDTPQHNNLAELAFPSIMGKARAMMLVVGVPTDVKAKVALEAITCATMLDGLAVVQVGDKVATRDKHVYRKTPSGPRT